MAAAKNQSFSAVMPRVLRASSFSPQPPRERARPSVHKSVLKVVLSARRNFCDAKLLLDVILDVKWLRA